MKDIELKTKLIEYISRHINCNINDFNKSNKRVDNNLNKNKWTQATSTYLYEKKNKEKCVYKLAQETNVHSCTKSCYKSKIKNCRNGFGGNGKALVESTHFDKENNLILKTDHKYLNNFNPYIACLRCNHDIKLIVKSKNDSLASIYYIKNYVIKNGINNSSIKYDEFFDYVYRPKTCVYTAFM
ncbi:unnamed protein product [Brachionus calyciflorus]|uniref:Uncharacterized protein n=1 Tax=Brachionus calyciflorus TaxID=104777 RepID=A0A814R544_9BILA|nr:unnamed protein product [Brachionus calyciflorus]